MATPSTSALSVPALVEMMKDATRRTYEPDLRYFREIDAVLYGKISQLLSLADKCWINEDLTEEDFASLTAASDELEKALNHLTATLFPEG